MKFSSLDLFGVSPFRIACFASIAAAGGVLLTRIATGDALQNAGWAVALAVGALVFYFVLSTPRRLADSQRLSEARESPLLSASTAACLAMTGSRARTVLLARARDPALKTSLEEAGRRILLGTGVERALEGSARPLVSDTAVTVLKGLARFAPEGVEQGDDEALGIAASSDLSRETRVPILMTACFFTPILLVLYAVFSHAYSATDLVELSSLEFIVLDLAFFLSAAERNRR